MADSSGRGILSRLASVFRPASESKAIATVEAKAQSPGQPPVGILLPRYGGGVGFQPDFIPLDAHGQVIDTIGESGLAFVAYWYVATRWRAQKLAEAPLMVVEEDQETGVEEWLSDHDLADVLENPTPDYDMGELIERTSRYLDDGAECLWVMDRDRAQRVARLTPFRRSEFTVEPKGDRLFGLFKVTALRGGPKEFTPEQVVYFRDGVENWGAEAGRSRLDVALQWLRLGEQARQTVKDLLENAVWPSAVAIPDAAWNPDKDQLEMYKSELQRYAQPGQKGKAFAMTGGGSFEVMSARIRDLVPTEVLDRVESVVSAVSGVPAIVLQFQIGMENSPWSQMEQARRMAYDDTIQPTWRKLERSLTRQMLRPDDEDLTHFIRFDRSKIASLQPDRLAAATLVSMISRIASVNERREMVGLEKVDDPKAEDIPELTTPIFPPGFGPPGATEADDEESDDDTPKEKEEKALRRKKRRQKKVAVMSIALRNESVGSFQATAERLLKHDQFEIERIIRAHITEPPKSALPVKSDRGKQRALSAVLAYLRDTSTPAWMKAMTPLIAQTSERGAAVIAADIGINYNLLHPHVVSFAKTESSWLIKGITETTRESVANALAAALEKGLGTADVARAVADAGGFAPSRSKLIARTESTRSSAGGPTEALKMHAEATGRRYVKTWSGALDERERDEHVALEGETVGIDEKFSNGLDYPSEPNCRCAPIFSEVEK